MLDYKMSIEMPEIVHRKLEEFSEQNGFENVDEVMDCFLMSIEEYQSYGGGKSVAEFLISQRDNNNRSRRVQHPEKYRKESEKKIVEVDFLRRQRDDTGNYLPF